jgi:hypothetical protein
MTCVAGLAIGPDPIFLAMNISLSHQPQLESHAPPYVAVLKTATPGTHATSVPSGHVQWVPERSLLQATPAGYLTTLCWIIRSALASTS